MRRTLLNSLAWLACGLLASCGGAPKTPTAPVSKLKFRAFLANQNTSTLQIIDEQKDQLSLTNAVSILDTTGVSATPVYMIGLPPTITVVLSHSPSANALIVVDNVKESQIGNPVPLPGYPDDTAVTSDGKTAYVAIRETGQIVVVNLTTQTLDSAVFTIPGVNRLALSPDHAKLLAFSAGQDAFTIINTGDNTTQAVTGPNLNRPNYALFSADSKTAYILDCGPECGGRVLNPNGANAPNADITALDLTAATPVPGASVFVDGATIGITDSSGNAYVAGTVLQNTPGGGRLDVVALSNLTVAKSVVIGDGFHARMAFTPNSKLYIGARLCSNVAGTTPPSGCLSIYNISAGTALIDSARGDVTGIQPVTADKHQTVYVTEGGELVIYDISTDQPQATQIDISGFAADVVSAQ